MIDDRSTPADVEKAYWSAQGHVSRLSAELADTKLVLIGLGFEHLRADHTGEWVKSVVEELRGG